MSDACAFCPAPIYRFRISLTGRKQPLACRRRSRQRPQVACRSTRLLVIELEAIPIVSGSAETKNNVKEFHERVDVERAAGGDTAYLIYSSSRGYQEAMKAAEDARMPSPDALVAVNGSELYQKGFATPDPYWEQTIRQEWDPKPTRWVIGRYFGEQLAERGTNVDENLQMAFRIKQGCSMSALSLRDAVAEKLDEMGIKGRVGLQGGSASKSSIVVMPTAGGVSKVVKFCAEMLKISGEGSVFVFGGPSFVESCIVDIPNAVGIVPEASGSHRTTDSSFLAEASSNGQVLCSKSAGLSALLEGIIHYAIL